MKLKKVLAVSLAAAMTLSMAACGGSSSDSSAASDDATTGSVAATTTESGDALSLIHISSARSSCGHPGP